MVYPVIKRLSTQSERVVDFTLIESLFHPVHNARFPHIVVGINQHFRPAAQIL